MAPAVTPAWAALAPRSSRSGAPPARTQQPPASTGQRAGRTVQLAAGRRRQGRDAAALRPALPSPTRRSAALLRLTDLRKAPQDVRPASPLPCPALLAPRRAAAGAIPLWIAPLPPSSVAEERQMPFPGGRPGTARGLGTPHTLPGGLTRAEDTAPAHLLQQPSLLVQPGLHRSDHLLELALLL